MQLTFFDLKKGLKFTAPGAGHVEYVLESWDKIEANLKRVKDSKMTTLPTENLLAILNRADVVLANKDWFVGATTLLKKKGFTKASDLAQALVNELGLVKQAKKVKLVATVALFRNNSGNLEILLERRGLKPEAHEWSLPGGHIDKIDGDLEDYSVAASRELLEETGVSVEPKDLIYVCELERENKRGKEDILFTATIPFKDSEAEAGSDAEKVQWVALDNIPDLVFSHNLFVELSVKKICDHRPVAITNISHNPIKTNRGFLIVFEGVDGSGKSTQHQELIDHLEKHDYDFVSTRWSSSDLLGDALRYGKKEHLLSPVLYSLLHAADMVSRYEQDILPALAKNKIVVCDRYVYTSFVRDMLRDIDPEFLNLIYGDFREPDIVFYCRAPLDLAFERLQQKGLSYYGSGMDIHFHTDDKENCKEYQKQMHELYEQFLPQISNCLYVDTEGKINDIADAVWKTVKKSLEARNVGADIVTDKSKPIDKEKGVVMEKEVQEIKAGLLSVMAESGEQMTSTPSTTVTEEAPLLPYEEMKRMPQNFPIEEYSLKPAGDLRRMAPLVKQLEETTAKIKTIDESIGHWQSDLTAKVNAFKEKEGYDVTKQELAKLTQKAADDIQRELSNVQSAYGESKNILLEYQDRIYSIYDKITKITVSDKEKLSMYEQALTKLLSPELVKSITSLVDQGVSDVEKAKTEINRRFVSFPEQKDIRKKVKEELPKSVGSVVTADAAQSIKDFFSNLWQSIKGLFSPIKENASDLLSLLQTQVEPVLEEAVVASKESLETVSAVKAAFEEHDSSSE